MIRLLLAVAVAGALLASALPAVESAAADRTAASLDREISRLDRAGASLLARDDPGARRVVSLTLPAESLASAGVGSLTIGCRASCAVRYTLESGAARTRRLGFPLTVPGGNVTLSRPGEHRLTLALVRTGDGRAVSLRAPGAES